MIDKRSGYACQYSLSVGVAYAIIRAHGVPVSRKRVNKYVSTIKKRQCRYLRGIGDSSYRHRRRDRETVSISMRVRARHHREIREIGVNNHILSKCRLPMQHQCSRK